MIYNVFKDIPEMAWQIINLYDKPTALILYKPRNLTPNLITADNTLGILIVKNLSVSS